MTLTGVIAVVIFMAVSYGLGIFVGMHIKKPKVITKTKKGVSPVISAHSNAAKAAARDSAKPQTKPLKKS
jgi:uncharacterized protein YebE (UPF0316 family)|tara:strand:+ start:1821 stop:2030 length:210 start_codon:yes stop_codon:yes gene_type:complete